MKKIQSKMKVSSLALLTSLYMSFFRRSRAANSAISVEIPPKFKLIQAFMVVHVTWKNEEDPIKNEGTRVLTRFSPLKVRGNFFKCSRAANSAVHCRIGPNFESSKLLWLSSLPARMKKIQSKMKALDFYHYVYGIVFKRSRAANSAVPGRIRLKFKLIRDVMVVLLTCKNKEDLIKNEGAKVLTR